MSRPSVRRVASGWWLVALLAAGATATAQDAAPAGDDKPEAGTANAKPDSQVPLEEIRRYVTVYNTVKQAYVEPVDDRKLMQSAIRGLLLDLDPHSAYLVRSDAQSLEEDSSGAYDGIGVDVQVQPDGTILVIAPIDDTPAARAGVKPGDLIIAIDGKPLTPDSLGDNPLRGEPGSSTVLSVQREGQAKPLDITVKRETIRISSVRGRMLEPGYGYIRISAFQADTANDFVRQLDELSAQAGADKRLRGLVLDLRSNPVVDTVFNATAGDRLRGAPVVVLVDAGSASASEVLAAALRDNGRARVVGSRTFGKGSVQTVLPLDNGDAVKLTTARYFTPSGRSIQARGIEPDVVLKPEGARSAGSYSESALPGHLRGDQEAAGQGVGDVLDGDAPIAAALGVLKTQGAKPLAASAKP
jgi:carboxyl-terminal processing protease